MGLEIERKFLVEGEGWRDGLRKSASIVQGYLRSEDVAIRVRIEGARGVLTFKARESGLTRGEWEYEVPVADAEELVQRFCGDRVVRKTRHYTDVGGLEWTIDEFTGRHAGLVIAEVELDGERQQFESPAWLGREVSHDRSFYNEALALG